MKMKIFFLILIPLVLIGSAAGQKNNKKIAISGLVTDALNRPLSGALILIDNKNTSIVTNNKGVYSLKVKPDADTITVLTFNNGVVSEPINGRTTINFILGASASQQTKFQNNSETDKVVNIGYGNVKEKDLLTQVSTVNEKTGKYDTYKDIYEILKGTPGVRVSGKSIMIQGPSSINLSTEPLFVVDGMTVQTIDDISPRMVESISVLKGAAASIYGSRGANGVILITLISGSSKNR